MCIVLCGKVLHSGIFYFETDKFIVLLNNASIEADLGPLKSIKEQHIEPELEILVLRKSKDYTIKFLGDLL